MSITFTLWDGSSNSVTFEPEWAGEEGGRKSLNLHRAQQGNLYRYTYGSWREFDLKVEYLPNSAALFINSLWLANEGATLEINLDGSTDTFSVTLTNKELPFKEWSIWDHSRRKGQLKLVEY